MIFISELFPNPVGKDAGAEWIEVCNNGTEAQSFTGWKLQDASAKNFIISDISLAPQSCAVFGNAETKISLNNDKETISLFDASGIQIDSVSYSKAVKDDYALARTSTNGELQITTTPTRGIIENRITIPISRTKTSSLPRAMEGTTEIPTTEGVGVHVATSGDETILVSGTNIGEVILIGACIAGVLAALFVKTAARLKTEN